MKKITSLFYADRLYLTWWDLFQLALGREIDDGGSITVRRASLDEVLSRLQDRKRQAENA